VQIRVWLCYWGTVPRLNGSMTRINDFGVLCGTRQAASGLPRWKVFVLTRPRRAPGRMALSARFLKQRSVSTRNAFDEQVILLSFKIELDFSHFLIEERMQRTCDC
jgi:hypothetical protein